jgi:hypothetical protein
MRSKRAPVSTVAPERPAPRRFAWRGALGTPALLFGFFVSVYALTSAGVLDSADGVLVAKTSQALLLRHTLALPRGTPNAVTGVGGYGYSIYGIGQSIIEMPFLGFGLLLRSLTHHQLASNDWLIAWTTAFTNSFVTALGCVVFFLLVRRLGATPRRGIALTLLYGLCTLAWPYAKTDFTEPLQTLSLLTAAYAALRAREPGQERWLWAAGSALGLAILTKSALFVAVPAFAAYVASASLLGADRRGVLRLLRKAFWWSRLLRRQARLLAPVALAIAVTLWLNAVRFGSPLDNGYTRAVNGDSLIGPLPWGFFAGAFGLLFSFNTGIIFYSTPVVFGIIGLRRFARRQPRETLLIGVLGVSFLVLYSVYRYWAGLSAFGPRYLVPLIPFLLLPAVDAFPGVLARPRVPRWTVAFIAVVALAGFIEQALGVLVCFGVYSALTCLTSPCPASLDASQSELLYDIWLLPTSLAYNFLGHSPHVVLSGYPFGAAPIGRTNWAAILDDRMRYFWFVPLPHPKAMLAVGLMVCGLPIFACLRGLLRAAGLDRVGLPRNAGAGAGALLPAGVAAARGRQDESAG